MVSLAASRWSAQFDRQGNDDIAVKNSKSQTTNNK
jgi:hypothetical protein